MQHHFKTSQIVLGLGSIGLLFWWPLSHLFYPVWYHRLLGFENPMQYANNPFITVIGFSGFFPTMLLFFSAINPIRNRDMIKTSIMGSIFGGLMYVYLIKTEQFPTEEYLNVSLFFTAATLLTFFYYQIVNSKELHHVS